MLKKCIKEINKQYFYLKKVDTEMVQKYMKSYWVSLIFGEVKIKPKFTPSVWW